MKAQRDSLLRTRQCETRREHELGTRALELDQLTSAGQQKCGELLRTLIGQELRSKAARQSHSSQFSVIKNMINHILHVVMTAKAKNSVAAVVLSRCRAGRQEGLDVLGRLGSSQLELRLRRAQ